MANFHLSVKYQVRIAQTAKEKKSCFLVQSNELRFPAMKQVSKGVLHPRAYSVVRFLRKLEQQSAPAKGIFQMSVGPEIKECN